jgi:cytochrome c oxidase subunit 3
MTMSQEKQLHPYHLVDPSPWPLLVSVSVLVTMIGAVLAMHSIEKWTFIIGVVGILYCAFNWWRDIIKESRQEGLHTQEVKTGLRVGMALFIASEVMFFVAFFWAYFNAALNPTEPTGFMWPPKSIQTLDPFHLPYFNTLLLLLSGTTVTWAHHALLEKDMSSVKKGLFLTVLLGGCFTSVQAIEYAHAGFTMKDGIYPSTFYLATGFHGAHVIIGTVFLLVCFFRSLKKDDLTPNAHVGFEAAAWYWHFVDVVWLFLFVAIYYLGYRAPVMG